jgi:hypothetical protein
MALGHLLYISDALRPMTREDLDAIRDVSNAFNAKHDITGVLLYSAGHFVQLLEGEPRVVRDLYDKIVLDPRHWRVRLLVERPADRRLFADWDMGVLDLDRHARRHRESLDELIELAGTGATSPDGTPIEMEILSRFCMLLPAA